MAVDGMKNELASEDQKKKLHAIPEIKLPRGVFNPHPPFPLLVMMCYFLCALSLSFFFLLCICIHSSDSARTAHSCVCFFFSQRPSGCLHAGVLNCLAGKLVLIEKSFIGSLRFLIRFHGFIGLQRQRSHEIRQSPSSLVGLFECDFGGFYSVGQLKKKKNSNIHHLRGPVDKATKPLSLIEEKHVESFQLEKR